MNIALIGFGNVGQGFVTILRDRADDLQARYSFAPRLVAVATRSRGTLVNPNGLNPGALLDAIADGSLGHYPDVTGLQRGWSAERIALESGADVLIEASPSDLETGQPALELCYAAFQGSKHVVLANKGPVAVDYAGLQQAAERAGKRLYFEATVMAGTPALRLALYDLAGSGIRGARGILNGTTNYILTEMENEQEYADALTQAQQAGYAESDPRGDVEGWDAAGKVIILAAALFGLRLKLADIDVTGITGITSADVASARAAGERWRLIARVTPEGGSVGPERLPLSDPLAGVVGATNAITYDTDLLGPVTLVGAGAGRQETGFALLADLLDLHQRGG
jgi:homoserine dehydrogenase